MTAEKRRENCTRMFVLVKFSRKTGKIDLTMEGMWTALLRLWAIQNITKTEDVIIFDQETGEIAYYIEGGENFPKITESDDLDFTNIEDYCPGMLAAVSEEV